jgi:hypothetical protein
VLLVGLLLNAMFGASWADPLVAVVIAAVAITEAAKPGAASTAASPPNPGLQQPRHLERATSLSSGARGLRRWIWLIEVAGRALRGQCSS